MVNVDPGGQSPLALGNRAVIEPIVVGVICVVDDVIVGPRRRPRAVCLGLLQNRRHVLGRDRVDAEARFESVQPEGCQHQQHWDEYDEQPRHELK
ncbi:MAG: hypothetical protein QOD97_357 [Mycobacterium sp.]|nr:hypothetical protein [Mycobacterium sp.]